MSHLFNLKYDEMKSNMPSEPGVLQCVLKGEAAARNVCFVLKSGNKKFLNYGYLVSGDYIPADNQIILFFTSHQVLLEGLHLETLFKDLMEYMPTQISAVDSRYNALGNESDSIVNNIVITELD